MNALLRNLAAVVIVIAIYYAVPVEEHPSTTRLVLGLIGTMAGIVALGGLIVSQILRRLRAAPGEAKVEGLLVLLYLVVVVFASGYLLLARSVEGQFAGMRTKTDALYFTVSTLATVGFGDVHATGQLARLLVTIQIVFDLVFVGALVATLSTGIRERAAQRRRGPNGPKPTA